MILAIDPGASAGFAVLDGGRVVWCAQSKPTPERRFSTWADLIAVAVRMGATRAVVEEPCYRANQERHASVTAALAERVGELRGLAWRDFPEVESIPWDRWQALPGWAEPLAAGPYLSERRSLRYAVDVLGVPRAWLTGERGAILNDAAAACCIGAATVHFSEVRT